MKHKYTHKQKVDKIDVEQLLDFDVVEIRTDERITYFIMNHDTKNAYYFEKCLN